ncbi:MAG: MEKHLA domain-containing protein, partial [Cyanothece sp. SIO1E1]|nr:MEKHLA domain-containing protein [Cyanothece sp. SIO1E1]
NQLLLNSYQRWLGQALVPPHNSAMEQAQALFQAPFVVVSHGAEHDPILNYGNQRALDLWQLDWGQLIQTPSRLTAEPIHRITREQMLAEVTEKGFIDNYRGVRIARTGRKFLVEKAIVWNILDPQNTYCGQAATFSQWSFLD